MARFILGGVSKLVVTTTSDGEIKISQKNGKVLKTWSINEIAGIAFVKPESFRDGRLAFCENYQDTLVQKMSTVFYYPHSLQVKPSQLKIAEELIVWFTSNKASFEAQNSNTRTNAQSPYDMEIVQKNSLLAIQGMTLIIRNTGVVGQIARGGMQGEKRILIRSILSIQFKKPSAMTLGYIQFETAGGSQKPARGGLLEAAGDENSVLFDLNKLRDFELFRDRVEELMNQDLTAKSTTSDADELAKFARLRDEGVISEEEFSLKKKMILGL